MVFCIIAVREGVYGGFLSFFSSYFSVVAVLYCWKKGWKPVHRFDNVLFPLLAYEGGGVLTLLGLALREEHGVGLVASLWFGEYYI